jgi:hypothetical protein
MGGCFRLLIQMEERVNDPKNKNWVSFQTTDPTQTTTTYK